MTISLTRRFSAFSILATSALLASLALAPLAKADAISDARANFASSLKESNFGGFINGLLSMSEETELTGKTYNIKQGNDDKQELNVRSAPFFLHWDEKEEVGWYSEGSLGWAHYSGKIPDVYGGSSPTQATAISYKWDVFGVLAGMGPEWHLTDDSHNTWSLAPVATVGVAYLTNKATYSGPGADATRTLADGLLFGWQSWTLTTGGALRAQWEHDLGEGRVIDAIARIDSRYTTTLQATDSAQETSAWLHLLSLQTRYSAPLSSDWSALPTHWNVVLGYRRYLTDTTKAFGFRHFVELGGGVTWPVAGYVPLLKNLGVQASVLAGDHVTGWSLGVATKF